MTVVQGASGTATVSVTSLNGFAGTIQFECTGMPIESSCNFAQDSITIPASGAVSASSAVTTTLAVTTTGTTVTTLGILGLLFGWGSSSRKKLRYRSTIWIGMALLLTAVTGCIGSNRYVQSNGTPPGVLLPDSCRNVGLNHSFKHYDSACGSSISGMFGRE